MPPGRPKIKITPERRNLIRKLASYGLNIEQIADCIHVSHATLERRIKEDAPIRRAFKEGRAEKAELVSRKIDEKIRAGNIACLIFYAKTRMGWKEYKVVEATGKDGADLMPAQLPDLSKLTDAQVRALIKKSQDRQGNKKGEEGNDA